MVTQLSGKVALVTGAGSGIGRASAIAFALAGAKVVVADVALDGGEETVNQIKRAGGEARFVVADVSKTEDVQHMVDWTLETYDRLDFAHNNAGIVGNGTFQSQFHEYLEDAWDRVLSINLKGVWLCMKAEIAQMLKQGGGAIVNTSSIAGLVGSAGPAYCASKHGVVGLTKTAALEYAQRGIRVNAVCPGVIRSSMTDQVIARIPGIEERFLAVEPIGRFGTTEEVAAAVIWLCSDASSFITGVALPVDGGMVAG